jgi:hypothetical protein
MDFKNKGKIAAEKKNRGRNKTRKIVCISEEGGERTLDKVSKGLVQKTVV